jgi:O-antigen ligase
MTSILTTALLASAGLVLFIDRQFIRHGFGRLFSVTLIMTVLAAGIVVIILGPDVLFALMSQTGRDFTFSGRTELWSYVFEETRERLFLGYGFGGYWMIGRANLVYLYDEFLFLPNQAHLGYLDLLNQTGLIGLCLFALMLFSYCRLLFRFGKSQPWAWFLLGTLIINLQESTLFRQNMLSGVMFIFAFLALCSDSVKKETTGQPTMFLNSAPVNIK